jgi:hypothetical protein
MASSKSFAHTTRKQSRTKDDDEDDFFGGFGVYPTLLRVFVPAESFRGRKADLVQNTMDDRVSNFVD